MFGESVASDRVAITTFDLGGAVTLMDVGLDGKGPLYLINGSMVSGPR